MAAPDYKDRIIQAKIITWEEKMRANPIAAELNKPKARVWADMSDGERATMRALYERPSKESKVSEATQTSAASEAQGDLKIAPKNLKEYVSSLLDTWEGDCATEKAAIKKVKLDLLTKGIEDDLGIVPQEP